MGIIQSVKSFYRNLFNFRRRAIRSEFWWAIGYVYVVSAMAISVASIFLPEDGATPSILAIILVLGPLIIFSAIHWIGSFSLYVRRLHDLNLSALLLIPTALFCALSFIPQLENVPSAITCLAMFIPLFIAGTKGENRYGPDPLASFREAFAMATRQIRFIDPILLEKVGVYEQDEQGKKKKKLRDRFVVFIKSLNPTYAVNDELPKPIISKLFSIFVWAQALLFAAYYWLYYSQQETMTSGNIVFEGLIFLVLCWIIPAFFFRPVKSLSRFPVLSYFMLFLPLFISFIFFQDFDQSSFGTRAFYLNLTTAYLCLFIYRALWEPAARKRAELRRIIKERGSLSDENITKLHNLLISRSFAPKTARITIAENSFRVALALSLGLILHPFLETFFVGNFADLNPVNIQKVEVILQKIHAFGSLIPIGWFCLLVAVIVLLTGSKRLIPTLKSGKALESKLAPIMIILFGATSFTYVNSVSTSKSLGDLRRQALFNAQTIEEEYARAVSTQLVIGYFEESEDGPEVITEMLNEAAGACQSYNQSTTLESRRKTDQYSDQDYKKYPELWDPKIDYFLISSEELDCTHPEYYTDYLRQSVHFARLTQAVTFRPKRKDLTPAKITEIRKLVASQDVGKISDAITAVKDLSPRRAAMLEITNRSLGNFSTVLSKPFANIDIGFFRHIAESIAQDSMTGKLQGMIVNAEVSPQYSRAYAKELARAYPSSRFLVPQSNTLVAQSDKVAKIVKSQKSKAKQKKVKFAKFVIDEQGVRIKRGPAVNTKASRFAKVLLKIL